MNTIIGYTAEDETFDLVLDDFVNTLESLNLNEQELAIFKEAGVAAVLKHRQNPKEDYS